MAFSSRHKDKAFHIDAASPLPMNKVKSYGTWAADTHIERVTFRDYQNKTTDCGMFQTVF